MVSRYFPLEEYESRHARTLQEMERRGYDIAVVFGKGGGAYEKHGDLLYLTNYYSSASGQEPDNDLLTGRSFAAVIMRKGSDPELHADIPGKREDLLGVARFQSSYNIFESVANALKASGDDGKIAIVGMEYLPVRYFREFEASLPGAQLDDVDDLVLAVRRYKSPLELQMYREGGEIASEALNQLIEGLVTGKTEAEAAADAASYVITRGGSFLSIPCSHGDRINCWTRNPLYGYSLDAPQPGDMVRGWVLGPIYQGYYFDPGRTTVAGLKPTHEQRELIESCANIVDTIIGELRHGVSVMELAKLGLRMTREAGGGNDEVSEQWPLYGHGLGLFWENPYIGVDMCNEHDIYEENMVVGIEAFLGRGGVGTAGFEQNLIIKKDGAELITTTPMIFW